MNKMLALTLILALVVVALPAPALAQDGDPADLVPAGAPFFVSIDTRPGIISRIANLTRLLDERAAPDLAEQFDLIPQGLLMDRERTFARDIRPWLGDQLVFVLADMPPVMSLAMAGSESDAPPPQIDFAMMIAVTNPAAANAFLARMLERTVEADTPLTAKTYGGFDYSVRPGAPSSEPDVAFGIIGDYLVFALGEPVMQSIIDVANGQTPALSGEPGFERVYGGMDPESFVRVFVGPSLFTEIVGDPLVAMMLPQMLTDPQMAEALDQLGLDATDPQDLQQQMVDLLATFQGVGLGFRHVNDALVMDFVAGIDLDALESLTGQPQPRLEQGVGEAIMAYLPADVVGVFASRNLAAMFDSMLSTAMLDPDAAENIAEAEAMLQEMTDLTMRDMFAWADGAFAVGLIPNPQYDPTVSPGPIVNPVNVVAAVETTDPVAAQRVIDALVVAALRNLQPVQSAEIDGVQVAIFADKSGLAVQFAIVDGYMLVATGDEMAKLIETARGGPNYTQNPEWVRLTDIAAADGPFFAALDIGALARLSGEDVPPDAAQMLRRLRSAAIIAPASPGGGPARWSFILTLAEQ